MENSDFIVPVLGYADNVLCNPTPGAEGGEFWEARGLWDSVALPFYLECQLPDNWNSTLVLCPCSGPVLSLACASHSCGSANLISLLLTAKGSTSHNRISVLYFFASPVCSPLPTFSALISQACLYVELRILC